MHAERYPRVDEASQNQHKHSSTSCPTWLLPTRMSTSGLGYTRGPGIPRSINRSLTEPSSHSCTLRGRTDLVVTLLRPMLRHPNPYLAGLMSSVSSLFSASPQSTAFTRETTFVTAVHEFRGRARTVFDGLSNAIAEMAKVDRGAGALEPEFVEDLEVCLTLLLRFACGEAQAIWDLADDWVEALGGFLRWVDPSCKRDDLP